MYYTRYDLELRGRLPLLIAESAHCVQDYNIFISPRIVNGFVRDALRLDCKAEEQMVMLALDSRYHLLGVMPLTKGTVDNVRFSPREMFIRLLMCGAVCFVLVHNHPSGDVTPSDDDNNATKIIRLAGRIMSIPMLDHIIVGADGAYYSYVMAEKLRQAHQRPPEKQETPEAK